ncbi:MULTISPECIES: hypothetical protein [Actinomadura]|uniref:Regulator component n=1 Tax=Actinomadura yumaensis TaxID=111807 RepID=A0ABW2CM57_9ACTN|nr:hypothetical protein [Actinomadura sp. J1-007]MWK37131.1 hypothetical protein [Actinomadura sp. J1-007]
MTDRDVRRRCRALVDSLDIPDPFDIGEFCLQIERRRGRSIRLNPIETAPGTPCGMWVSTAGADYIFHEQGTSPLHQRHIILHEIGHMLFAHRVGPGPGGGLPGLLLPDLDPELIRSMLGRTAYDNTQELEAETFADLMSLVVEQPTEGHPREVRGSPPGQTEVVARIERTLGRPHSPRR